MLAPAVRAHENDIGGTTSPAMLKRIVEHHDVAPGTLRILGALETIRRHDDGHVGVEGTMDERFVLSIAAQDDGRLRAGTLQAFGKVGSERRLARAAHSEIPDAQRRNSRWTHGKNA
jgi:hypothetical protein